jgi:catechol 2,3-dioxygenase-like lactoylglutathione lyase family enzyme
MLTNAKTFSSFSVNDIERAKAFYSETLGLKVEQSEMGLDLMTANDNKIFVYPKPDHTPATYTVLNFIVDDIESEVEGLKKRGVQFEHYEGELQTDAKGIARGSVQGRGPDIAWFKDPAGNFLSVIQNWER